MQVEVHPVHANVDQSAHSIQPDTADNCHGGVQSIQSGCSIACMRSMRYSSRCAETSQAGGNAYLASADFRCTKMKTNSDNRRYLQVCIGWLLIS